jgi:hypothetical protein
MQTEDAIPFQGLNTVAAAGVLCNRDGSAWFMASAIPRRARDDCLNGQL